MRELTHLDLCSGIGGFALAARWAGFQTIGFSEIDEFCNAILRKHWPNVRNYGDLRTADFSGCRGTTILTAGYPCQPFSYAGERRGHEDNRHLWPAVLAAIKAVRPTWFIGENVSGHITMGLDSVLFDLESEGYAWRPLVIPACAINARHKRERIWILGHSKCGTGKFASGKGRMEMDGNLLDEARRQKMPNTAQGSSKDVAHPESFGWPKEREWAEQQGHELNTSGQNVAHPNGEGLQGWEERGECASKWPTWQGSEPLEGIWELEPRMGRLAHGVSARVDKLKGFGNAIVPQVAYRILHCIAEIENG